MRGVRLPSSVLSHPLRGVQPNAATFCLNLTLLQHLSTGPPRECFWKQPVSCTYRIKHRKAPKSIHWYLYQPINIFRLLFVICWGPEQIHLLQQCSSGTTDKPKSRLHTLQQQRLIPTMMDFVCIAETYPKCSEVCEVCGSCKFGWVGYTLGVCELPPGSWDANVVICPWPTKGRALATASAISLASASYEHTQTELQIRRWVTQRASTQETNCILQHNLTMNWTVQKLELKCIRTHQNQSFLHVLSSYIELGKMGTSRELRWKNSVVLRMNDYFMFLLQF